MVDDIAQNRAFVMDLLSSIGFEVFEADNGQSGLDRFDAVRPDLVLLDLIMPIMDGFTTAKTIRQNPRWQADQDPVIIAMSASTLNQGKPESLAAGCDAFLLKPIDTDELLHLIETKLHLKWEYEPEASEIGNTASRPLKALQRPSRPCNTVNGSLTTRPRQRPIRE